MTAAAINLGLRLAADLAELRELERVEPEAAEVIRRALIAHLRSAWPESLSELIRGPRGRA